MTPRFLSEVLWVNSGNLPGKNRFSGENKKFCLDHITFELFTGLSNGNVG